MYIPRTGQPQSDSNSVFLLSGSLRLIVTHVCTLSEPGQPVGKRAGLMIERLQVQIPAGAAGEFSSPESTLCADSYSVSVPPPCYRNGT